MAGDERGLGPKVGPESQAQWGGQLGTTGGSWAAKGHDEAGDEGRLVWQWCVE